MAGKLDMNTLILIVVAVIAVGMIGKQPAGTTSTGGGSAVSGEVDLCTVVNPTLSFTGQDLYKSGTAIAANEGVRILLMDGESKTDLGTKSLNSGTIGVEPKAQYKLYFGENSTTYYTSPVSKEGPCKDSTVAISGKLCTIDTAPTVTVLDEFGAAQSSGVNHQTIAASTTKDISIKVQPAAYKCYGNPNAPSKNALCLKYNSTSYTKVSATGASAISTPFSVTNDSATGYVIECYEMPLISNSAPTTMPVKIEAASTWVNRDTQNISVYIKDVDMDLNAKTLAEIWGFQDEDNNRVGSTHVAGIIRIQG